ncbi:MAG: response regulator transcription factor [Bacteroidales bacterium]|nr:response regulator transcription factor [Bacteroidales bacterium]
MPQLALIVEDHPIVSNSISGLIQSNIRELECHAVNTGQSGLAYLNSHKPDIILLDINLPDMSGIDFLRDASARFPNLKVLALTSIEQRHVVEQMMALGVNGFILKSSDTEEILEAISTVLNGGQYFSKQVSLILKNKNSNQSNIPLLTRREVEVLRLISDGLTNQEIADKLFISAWTVDSHRKNLLVKFDAKNTASLVKIAASHGLLDY